MIATRAADNQCTLAYANLVGAQRRADLRRRRLRQPERQAGARGAALRARATRRGRSISTAPRACAPRTPPGAPTARTTSRESTCPIRSTCRRRRLDRRDRRALTYPVPANRSFFLPGRDAAVPAARGALRGPPRRAGARRRRLLREDRRLQADRRRALRRARLAADAAHRAPLCRAELRPDDPGSLLRAFYMPSRYSSDETRQAARDDLRASSACRSRSCRIDEAFERELEAREAMLGRARR